MSTIFEEEVNSNNENSFTKIKIERPIYEHNQLRHDFLYEKPEVANFRTFLKPRPISCYKCILKTIPILDWLRQYNMREDLFLDILAGITLAIMIIPQGMAYALLALVPPVVGIYTSFFPVIIYIIFGTSKHNSMGTFAVISIMIGKVVLEQSDSLYFLNKTGILNNTASFTATGYSPVQVVTALNFVVSITQLLMFVLRLGFISVLLSETLVSGFTTGAAIQVLISQFKDLLGIQIPHPKGYFVNVKTIKALIYNIGKINYVTMTISAIVISILLVNQHLIKPILAKKSPIPIPIELIIIICTTLASNYIDLTRKYGVNIVGVIPTGFPAPSLPQLDLIYTVITDGIAIAIVSYSISLSMAMMFAEKLSYEVEPNQELLAMGAGNLFGSFFSSMPMSASLTRSMLQVNVGGKTQVVSLISCTILILVMLWLGPIFESVPKCVLASIIVVALSGLLRQVSAVFAFWKLSKIDALVWVVTCFTVIFVSIDIGLLVGVAMSLATIFILNFKPNTCLLGLIPNSNLYLDSNRYKSCKKIEGLKIFQYCGAINFANKNIFKSDLFMLIGINPEKEIVYRTKLYELQDSAKVNEQKFEILQKKVNYKTKCLILDFSTVSCIDLSGITMLKAIVDSFEKINISIYIAGCIDPVYNLMEKCVINSKNSTSLRLFPSIYDAVQFYNNTYVKITPTTYEISM